MHHLNRLVLVIMSVSSMLSLADEQGESPASRLYQHLDALHSIESTFTQVTTDETGRILQQSKGRLWVSQPSRFRIETDAPFPQTLVSDGQDFWAYDPDLEQVIIRDLDNDMREVPILLLGGNARTISNQYDISYYRDERMEHYVLTPVSTGRLFDTLIIQFEQAVPQAISLNDNLGQRTLITLDKVQLNQPVHDEQFIFDLPDDVDIIDDRSPD